MLTRLIILPLFCVIALLMFGGNSYAEQTAIAEPKANSILQRLIKRADTHIQQAQYEQALELLNEAYDNSNTPENKAIRNDVLNSMANVYYNTGQLEQAHRYYTTGQSQ